MATKRRIFWVALIGFPIVVYLLSVCMRSESPVETQAASYKSVLAVNNNTLYHVREIALYEAGSQQEAPLIVREFFVPSHSMLPLFTMLDCKQYDVLVSFEERKEQFFQAVDICKQEIRLTRKGFKEKSVSHD